MQISSFRYGVMISVLLHVFLSYGQNYQDMTDQLRSELEETAMDSSRVNLLNEISYNFRRIHPDSMIPYATQAFELAVRLDYIKGQSIAQKNIGIAKFKSGAPVMVTIKHYERAIQLSELIGDHATEAACLNNIALLKYSSNQLSDALGYYFKALDVYDKHLFVNDYVKGLIIGNIGVTFHLIGDTDNELKYIQEVIDYAQRYELPKLLSIYSDNLASTYVQLGRYQEAVTQCQKSMAIQKEQGDEQSYLQSLIAMSEAQLGLDNAEEAVQYAQESASIAESKNYLLIQAEALTALANAYKKKGLSDMAIVTGERAFGLLSESNRLAHGADIALLLSGIYKEQANLEKALYFLEWYQSANEKRSIEKEKFLSASLNQKLKSEIKQREIENLNQNNILRQRAINVLSVFLLLLALMLYGVYKLYRKSKQSSLLLMQQNQALEKVEINSLHKNKELQKYIESNIQLEQFSHIASHDLKTPLRTISSFTGLLKKKAIAKLSQSEVSYLVYIEKAVKQMDHLVNDLLIFSKVNSQKIDFRKFSLVDLLVDIIESLEEAISESGASISILELPDSIVADRSKLHRVLQNLIANAIKFVDLNEQPVITIAGSMSSTHYIITIADQGIGISEEFLQQIFEPYKQLHTKKKYDGTGLGLSICKKIIEQHKGTMSVDSTLGEGSVFTIQIPLQVSELVAADEQPKA